MSGSNALCICDHYADSHVECDCTGGGNGHGEAWHVVCLKCGCSNFQTDYEMMRCLKQEADERKHAR